MTRKVKVFRQWSPDKSINRVLVKILVVGLVLATSGRALAQEGGWSTPVMISTNTVSSWFSDVAVDDWGRPHVVWNSGRSAEQEHMDILMYSTLADEGWLEPNDIAVTAYGGYTVRPAIAVDSTAMLHVTFRGETTIYYTQAPASKAWSASSWTPRRRISGAGTGTSYYSDVSVDEQGGIHVVWNEGVTADIGRRQLWFGTPTGYLLYDSGSWQPQEPQAGLGNRQIHAMIEDDVGVQWFGTDAGVYRFDGSTWQILTTQDGLAGQQVNCVAQDVDGKLWLGTDQGVSVYDEKAEPGEDKWTTHTTGQGLPGNVVYAIATDPLGPVWVGTETGVASYDGLNWTSYTSQDGLIADEVLAVAVDDQGNTWAGTRQGVSRYDGQLWTTYTTESGLLGNVVTAIATDQKGTVWFGTDRGISQFDGQGWTSHTAGDGLVGGAVTALMVDDEGVVWVGTEAGASCYDGQTWKALEPPPESVGQRITAIADDQQLNAICPACADIFYRHSTDGGKSWSAPVNLSDSYAGSVKPQIHIGDGGSIYVTWEEGEDWYVRQGYPVASMCAYSPDNGLTWAKPTVFSSPLGTPQQITLGIGRENKPVVVWRLAEEESLYYYQVSADNGATWSEPESISGVIAKPWAPFSLDAYHAATDSAGNVHLLVLGRLSLLEKDLSLLHLVWNGSEWSSPTRIYASSDPPEWPRIDVGAGNKVCATWFTRDERHINDSERGRYKIWVSSLQTNSPPVAPIPLPTPTPTPASNEVGRTATSPDQTPDMVITPGTSGLPTGLDTESDEVIRLILALSPVAAILLVIATLRLGRLRRRR